MQNTNTPGQGERPANAASRRQAASSSAGQGGRAVPRQSRPTGQTTPRRAASSQRPADRRSEPEKEKQKKPKRQYRWFRAILMVIATLALCCFLSVFILDSAQDLFGLNQPDTIIEFTVPKDASNRQVADMLYDRGIITKSLTFFVYSSLKVDEGGFVEGDYVLNTNMGYDQIILKLEAGNTVREVVEGLTFVEGLYLRDIALKLEENKVCDAQEFMEYLETAELDYEFMDRMPTDDLRFHRLEGYVFPDTYDFYVGESVENVAAKFLGNFERKITDEMEARMLELGLTLDETIRLASIIQREAGSLEAMRNVSSAFHNRMNDTATFPQLQSDVTIFYVENQIKPYIQLTNQEMYDAYNTYVREGLPAGAICNPGAAAIEAALNPADTDYLYFVTDANGVFYYATTLEEHNANIRTANEQEAIGDNPGEVHGTGVQGNE
jgi:UPF0755 protein